VAISRPSSTVPLTMITIQARLLAKAVSITGEVSA
jgi:Arc/MetJ family transcription regulator